MTNEIRESNRQAREEWARRIAAGHRIEQQDARLREAAVQQFERDQKWWRRLLRWAR